MPETKPRCQGIRYWDKSPDSGMAWITRTRTLVKVMFGFDV